MKEAVIAHVVELWRFALRHWWHAPIAVFMFFAFTAVHEAAHAAAAIVQGGAVTEFVIFPAGGYLGQMAYEFPPGASYSAFAISMAPYFHWLVWMILASAIAATRRDLSFRAGSSVFLWLYVAPFLDIYYTWVGYLLGAETDFRHVFGAPTIGGWLALAAAVVVATASGLLVQRRLYPPPALSAVSYATAWVIGLGAIAALR